jgi:hypothetical protein
MYCTELDMAEDEFFAEFEVKDEEPSVIERENNITLYAYNVIFVYIIIILFNISVILQIKNTEDVYEEDVFSFLISIIL